jgi:hypothetical protein
MLPHSSFETRFALLRMRSKNLLILRRPRSGRLEG